MSLDSITEQIAHFFGAFELTIEQARLREQYEEFTALRRKTELEELEDATKINVKADLKLPEGEYDPLPYKFETPQVFIPPAPVPPSSVSDTSSFYASAETQEFYAPEALLSGLKISSEVIIIQIEPQIVTELIGSAVTYTFQEIILNDNDTIGDGDFRDKDVLMEEGEHAMEIAMSLHAIAAPSIHISDYLSIEKVKEIAEQMQSPLVTEVDGVTIYQFHGEDASGMIVNGEYVDEMPVWSDLLPDHHQTEEDEGEEGDAPDLLPVEWDQGDDSEFEDGHSVIAGGNLAINEVSITVGWVDAPNIVVGGQAMNLTVMSQVAVVSDIDEGEAGAQSDTHIVQAAHIGVEASEAPWVQDNVADPGEDPIVAIDWIEGDLIVTNFIQQLIDATDIDQISTEISASSTMYTLGDNVMTNVADIIQLGSFYDLIIVGGNMISVDVVSQTIVFMDDDKISGTLPTEDEENLVMNQATLTATGEDTHEEMSDSFADMVPLQEVDTDALEDALLNDPTYAGTELIRVLKIEGDLLQVNIIDQVTKLQDQDDISVDATKGEVASALGAGNAILNTANVNKVGVDSVVMAQDGEYSDLLLHQASLFDVPEEQNLEIANEAIAYLMEEADGPGNSENAPGQIKLTPSETATVDDGLQSMLA